MGTTGLHEWPKTMAKLLDVFYPETPRSPEQCSFHPGWLFDIGDEILPNYMGIIIRQKKYIKKHPVINEPGFNGSCHVRRTVFSRLFTGPFWTTGFSRWVH